MPWTFYYEYMSEFEIKIEEINEVTVVRTNGYLNDEGGEVFKDKCTALIDSGKIFLVFNLEKTPVINSFGLSIMLDIIVQAIDYNDGEVAITGLSQLTQTALQMTGVLTLAEVYPTEKEAIDALAEAAS